MFNIDNDTGAISLTKGDSAEIEVLVLWADGTERGVGPGDTLKFTIKPTSATSPVSLTKTSTTNSFKLVPADTSNLSAGAYVYDIDLTTAGGDVYTICPMASFSLLPEVS